MSLANKKRTCGECKDRNKASRLYITFHSSTASQGVVSFYDEEGNFHQHDTNTTTYKLECTNGHKFLITESNFACLSCGS